MRIGRRIGFMVWMAMALALCVASLAWACTKDAGISGSPSELPPGSMMTVEGMAFYEGGKVEVYLEDPNRVLTLVATATGPSFTVQVRVPADAAEGTHYLVAYGYNEEGQQEGSAQASITVARSSNQTEPEPTQPREKTNTSGDGASAPAPEPARNVAPTRTNRSQAPSGSEVRDPAEATTDVRVATAATSRRERGDESRRGDPIRQPSRVAEASAWGNMWSGFAADRSGVTVPSLSDSVPADEPFNLWVPLGLAAVAMLTMMVALGLAVVGRRRRVEIDSTDQ